MDRKAIARETLKIMEQGYYEYEGKRIAIEEDMEESIRSSILITPKEGEKILNAYGVSEADGVGGCPKGCGISPVDAANESGSIGKAGFKAKSTSVVENISTVEAIRKLVERGKTEIGVLNFASAKNPGGGFINGAMAQEESLAASSTLYRTLLANEEYYKRNREQSSMMYTDYGIYSPDVTFFRDGRFKLVDKPVRASVLTLPAVNMGQVRIKGEDIGMAQKVMRRRMELALAIFARQGAKNLVLGAYGCGVFRNDPRMVAIWWKELLEAGMQKYFDSIFYAVLDRGGDCIRAFEECV